SVLLFPASIASMFGDNPIAQYVSRALTPGSLLYSLVDVGLIIFFCYFYTAVTFNPSDVSDNLKKFGGYIPGIRPGQRTADFIDRILVRITLAGAIYLAVISVLPTLPINQLPLPLYFRRTAPPRVA